MKTVGVDAFITYYISYHYFKISKIRQKFKSDPIIKTSISKAYDIILDACVKYENYPIKNVREDAFYSFDMLLHYFKISKNRQKLKKVRSSKKAQAR